MTSVVGTINTKDNIVRAAAELLARGGREAVSTRAVAAAAGVQAPTIYRHFGDMQDLLNAVASYGFESYLQEKGSRRTNIKTPLRSYAKAGIFTSRSASPIQDFTR